MLLTLIANVHFSKRDAAYRCGYKWDKAKGLWIKPDVDSEYIYTAVAAAKASGFDFWVAEYEGLHHRNIIITGLSGLNRESILQETGFKHNPRINAWQKKVCQEAFSITKQIALDHHYTVTISKRK